MDNVIERYEYKYLVPEGLVPGIRATARATSKIDKYAGPDGTYRIRSLYFDTDRYDLFWANEREQADRFKLRARCYPASTESPVFLEVKRRVLDVIVKTRAAIPAAAWRDVLAGKESALAALSPGARSGAMRFLAPYHRHHIRPVLLVEYEREAYISEIDTYARLTFDRKIAVQQQESIDLEAVPGRWRPIDHRAQTRTQEPVCVLELKFERRPPRWMVALVQRLDLIRFSFSKYCYGVTAELTLPEARIPG
ncbi:polyphosphate polymerase domain-containing protein [Polyangium mundeleinium]|uniref:Polyphosphate polymerase domain-containing protein n=1 Tax=Polyangium mundeleinium TaxID=2995306 RepID=A0ABT5EUL4_9BACT|nr:polyphosphate polymerase domain-containing protein [Polyangium mundeleinium]MDC0745049.1 polyphosphate polymerase domain-containing protein [Polyangium mundeleinium]